MKIMIETDIDELGLLDSLTRVPLAEAVEISEGVTGNSSGAKLVMIRSLLGLPCDRATDYAIQTTEVTPVLEKCICGCEG